MGLFGKIKNILFEDEEEVEETMPVFTKDEVKPSKKEENVVSEKEEPIKVVPGSRFKNVKRDIDLSFDEKDVLDEVVNSYSNSASNENREQVPPKVEEEPVKQSEPENKSPFLSFDEDEFDRLNSRINRNEEKARRKEKDEKKEKINYQENARRANNNYSSTTPNRNSFDHNFNSSSGTNSARKFTPSPVISPVYGILDKNYKKDDIVDRDNADDIVRVKQNKVKDNKPEMIDELLYHEEKVSTYDGPKHNETQRNMPAKHQEIDLDYVRKKAYGNKDYVTEEEVNVKVKPVEKAETVEEKLDHLEQNDSQSVADEPKVEETMNLFKDESTIEDVEVPKRSEHGDEAEIDDIIKVPEDDEELITPTESSKPQEITKDKDISDLILDDMEKDEEVVGHRARALEDLEKTSTLQILDDIEKELNSIKPISKNEEKKDEDDDTLEDDLFNLIDSMYEGGDEEDD